MLEQGFEDPGDILHGAWRNKLADPIMRKAGIPILSSFNETLPMADMHQNNGHDHECTHYCHPSAPQVRWCQHDLSDRRGDQYFASQLVLPPCSAAVVACSTLPLAAEPGTRSGGPWLRPTMTTTFEPRLHFVRLPRFDVASLIHL